MVNSVLFTPSNVAEYEQMNYGLDLVYSSALSLLACARAQGTISILDSATMRPVSVLDPSTLGGAYSNRLPILSQTSFQQGTELLISSDLRGTICLWDLRSASCVSTWNANAPVHSFDINSAQHILAAGTELVEDDAKIHFWDIRNGDDTVVASFDECHSEDITQVSLTYLHRKKKTSFSVVAETPIVWL